MYEQLSFKVQDYCLFFFELKFNMLDLRLSWGSDHGSYWTGRSDWALLSVPIMFISVVDGRESEEAFSD
jgi:hypothetical protein